MPRDEEWVVCPHCGYQHGDGWEWCSPEEPKETTCNGCGARFECWAEHSVEYVSRPLHSAGGGDG